MKRTYSLTVVALSVSLFIYLFYRTQKTVINELIASLLSPHAYSEIRSSVAGTLPLHELIRFSLPGGLWVFCLTILSKDLYIKIRQFKVQIVAVPLLFAAGLEFFQFFHITRGTFDFYDLGFYLFFWLLASYGFKSHGLEQDILSPLTLKGFICLTCFLSVYLAHVNP
jgi:hypothetical protein